MDASSLPELELLLSWIPSPQVPNMKDVPMVLGERLPVKGLGSVEARPSPVHGTGVFATKDIDEGAVVTLYPADILLEKTIGKGGANAFMMPRVAKIRGLRHGTAQATVLDLQPYKFNLNKTLSIIGDPRLNRDPAYLGHLINDGVTRSDHTELSYLREAMQKNNCRFHVCAENRHVAMIAMRKIWAGEELFVTYGLPYWDASNS